MPLCDDGEAACGRRRRVLDDDASGSEDDDRWAAVGGGGEDDEIMTSQLKTFRSLLFLYVSAPNFLTKWRIYWMTKCTMMRLLCRRLSTVE